MNGDGFDDLIVGAFESSHGEDEEGLAYVYHGLCADTIDSDADLVGDQCDVCPALHDPMQEDGDGDGIGDACDGCLSIHLDADGDGEAVCEGDCDDGNALAAPHLHDTCGDNVDNDCDGERGSELRLGGLRMCVRRHRRRRGGSAPRVGRSHVDPAAPTRTSRSAGRHPATGNVSAAQ